MVELNEYINEYLEIDDINILIPSIYINRYHYHYHHYQHLKNDIINTINTINKYEKLLKNVVSSINDDVTRQRKTLLTDNVIVISNKINDIRYKIFQHYKANIIMSINCNSNSSSNVRRSYDYGTSSISSNVRRSYDGSIYDNDNDDDYQVEYTSDSIRQALIAPEHIQRASLKFYYNERIRISNNGINIDANAYKYSPWEGTTTTTTTTIATITTTTVITIITTTIPHYHHHYHCHYHYYYYYYHHHYHYYYY